MIQQVAAHQDDSITARRLGLIVLSTDLTTERDFTAMTPADEVAVYTSRITYANPTNRENLLRMLPRLTDTASLLVPEYPFDAIYFACMAASVAIGDEQVARAVNTAHPATPVITPARAAVAALQHLRAAKISILAPYTSEVSQTVARYFSQQGFEVLNTTCLGFTDDRKMAHISPQSLLEAAAHCSADADALYISCTALRSAGIAGQIEAYIGKPVVTANQAGHWLAMQTLEIDSSGFGFKYGSLYNNPGSLTARQ